jgi:hypothetical protein
LIALVIVLVFLLALGLCVWGFIASVRLMFRGFRGILAPTTQKRPPESPPKARENVPRPEVPVWTAKLVSDHLATCPTCRESYVNYTMSLLEPTTISRILALVEDHEPVTP